MFDSGESRTGIFLTTAKAVGAIALISVFAGQYLADRPDIVANIANVEKTAVAALSRLDPATTGSLRTAMDKVSVDPCVAPVRAK